MFLSTILSLGSKKRLVVPIFVDILCWVQNCESLPSSQMFLLIQMNVKLTVHMQGLNWPSSCTLTWPSSYPPFLCSVIHLQWSIWIKYRCILY